MSFTTPIERGTGPLPDVSSEAPKKDHEIKVASVFKRIVNSPLFWTVCGVVAIAALTVVAITVPILAIGIVAGAALLGISATAIAMRKRLVYEISLAYNCIRNKIDPVKWPKYDAITDDLFLGRLPTKNDNDHISFPQDFEIGAVLSMVEHFENHSLGILTDPVTPEDWKSLGIEHLQIEAKDFHPLTIDEIREGVEFIEENIEKGLKVYVHCKAGRSRSAAIIIAYLVKNGICETVEDAIAFVKQKRPVIKLGAQKIESIEKYINNLN